MDGQVQDNSHGHLVLELDPLHFTLFVNFSTQTTKFDFWSLSLKLHTIRQGAVICEDWWCLIKHDNMTAVSMTLQESSWSYLLLFIVVSWVLDVVDVLKLLICPRTKLSSCESRRHCVNIALCSCYSLLGLSQRSHVEIFMFLAPNWLHFAL